MVGGFSADTEAREICVAEFCFAAGAGFFIVFCAPPLCRALYSINLVVYFTSFERCSEAWRDVAGDSEAFVAVVEDVEEGKGGVFGD